MSHGMDFEHYPLQVILKMEGVDKKAGKTGLVDDPNDPGGITNWGISYRFLKGVRPHTTEDTIRNLTYNDAALLYETYFWNKIHGSAIHHYGLALFMFDMAVNMGIFAAVEIFQKSVGLRDDGIIGPKTRAALFKDYEPDGIRKLLVDLHVRRCIYYSKLGGFNRYSRGWLRRSTEVYTIALLSSL